eukprot:358539-Chlamydomonas_euryale.AAC.1
MPERCTTARAEVFDEYTPLQKRHTDFLDEGLVGAKNFSASAGRDSQFGSRSGTSGALPFSRRHPRPSCSQAPACDRGNEATIHSVPH